MTDHPERAHHGSTQAPSTVWTGRATNRFQWLLALAGAGCMALGIELAVGSPWSSGIAPLLMSVIGCVAVGLLILFGTLAFVHVAVKVDGDALEVRCGHAGLPRRRILLDHVVGAEYVPRINPRQWGGWGYRWRPEQGTAVVVRKGEGMALRLGDGRTFTVTVDDAQSAVRFIRARLHLAAVADRSRGRDLSRAHGLSQDPNLSRGRSGDRRRDRG